MDEFKPQPLRQHFSIEDQHFIIKEYLRSGASKDEIWRKYTGKADHGCLIRWMRNLGYLTSNQQLKPKLVVNIDSMGKKVSVVPEVVKDDFEVQQMKKRIAELEKQLKDAELKAIAFSTMVDIAEQEFKIPIRKKFNTKP
jgi:transposase